MNKSVKRTTNIAAKTKSDDVVTSQEHPVERITQKQEIIETSSSDNRLPATAVNDEFGDHADSGLQNITSKDLLIPRIAIIQALSPQLSRTKPEYIKEAHSGDICDVAMSELFVSILFLPVYYRKDYFEWAPRSEGKSFPISIHYDDSIYKQCEKDENGVYWHGKNKIEETAQFFGFNLSAGMRKCFIPFKGTQFKKAKKWLNLATGERLKRSDGSLFTPPLFYRTYKLGVAEEANNEGNWFGWTVERGPTLPELTEDTISIAWRLIKEESIKFLENLIKGEYRPDMIDEGADAPARSQDRPM